MEAAAQPFGGAPAPSPPGGWAIRDHPRLVSSGPATDADPRSTEAAAWLSALRSHGAEREIASERLHALLLKAARFELNRRRPALAHVRGEELDDLAAQAADDALMSILGKLDEFRGASRFTTWAYKFALLEAGVKLRRRGWQEREVVLDASDWSGFSSTGAPVDARLEQSELFTALSKAIEEALTPHQRQVFVALALNQIPIDVLAERMETNRGALYKTLHDARKKLRRTLEAAGHLESPPIPEAKS